MREDSSQTLIQYNIIEDPLTAENNELAGVRLVEVDENIIVNNIIRNHSSQIKFFGVGSGCPDSACGNFIENNDLYNEDSMRTDCNGNYTPSGDCTATESIMSSKVSGGSAVDEWNTVIRNRMRNARGADTDACCLGGGSGSCISISNEGSGSSNRTEYMLIRHNYCSEVEIGLKQPRSGSGDRISMIGNIFHDLVPGSPSSQPAVRLNWCVDCEAYFNLMIDTPSSFQSGGGEDAAGNMIINVPNFIDSGSSGDWSYNAYYESQDDPYSSPEIDLPTRESSDNAQFCIWLNLLDSPEQVCMDDALTTTNSPHHEWSNFSPLSGHGVNNASVGSYPLDIDWFEVVRSNPTSAGPFIESEAEQQLKLISSGKNRGFDKGFNRGYQ